MDFPGLVQCPVCNKRYSSSKINAHVDNCLNGVEEDACEIVMEETPGKSTRKRPPDAKTNDNDADGGWGFFMKKRKHAGNVNSPDASQSKVDKVIHIDSDTKCTPKEAKQQSDQSTKCQMKPNNKKSETCLVSNSHTVTDKEAKYARSYYEKNTNDHGTLVYLNSKVPLAEEMRPSSLEDYIGQGGAVGRGSLLGRLLSTDQVPSMILWGPPGCGKTTLARIIADRCRHKVRFVQLSATSAGVNDVKELTKRAKNELKMFKRRTVLFLDEVHRFNKLQQDSLLPHVEDGTITLIGATTENPSFQVNSALLSRCRVVVLEKLDAESIEKILMRAVHRMGLRVFKEETDIDRSDEAQSIRTGPERSTVWMEASAIQLLSHLCDGDARVALNGLQMTVQSQLVNISQSQQVLHSDSPGTSSHQNGGESGHCRSPVIVRSEHVKQGLQKSHIAYDKTGEEHYNIVSALIKSMRGSDDTAALYWLARMLEGGETPVFVARRLIVFASEDVGLADTHALPQAVATFQACNVVGMPESEKMLAQCVVYMSRAPKSVEVYQAYGQAKQCVRSQAGQLPGVPLHLRNAPTKLMKDLGYSKGYKYNPGYSEPVDQAYLPENMQGTNFFT